MISCESANKNTVVITEEDLNENAYRFNFMGVPFCVYTLYNFGMEFIRQVWGITKDLSVFDAILRLRYALVVGYFGASLSSPRYAFESDYSEVPLLIALLADGLSLVYDFNGHKLIRFAFLVVITGGCLFLRKRTTWKILLNTWKEDVDEEKEDQDFTVGKNKFLV